MAEYCSMCSPFKEMGGYDYDLAKIALDLEKGRSESFLCEGCENRGVYKDEDGRLYLAKYIEANDQIELKEVNIEELMA